MTAPLELLQQFEKAIEEKDQPEVSRLSSLLATLPLNSKDSITAKYRFALYLLNSEKKLPEAMAILKEITSSDQASSDDLYQAHISYAICLFNSNKKNQGVFELRKVLSAQKEPSTHSTMALEYLSNFLKEMKAPTNSIHKTYQERISHLNFLLENDILDKKEEALLKLRLAAALEDYNVKNNEKEALAIYTEISRLGSAIGKENWSIAEEGKKRLHKK